MVPCSGLTPPPTHAWLLRIIRSAHDGPPPSLDHIHVNKCLGPMAHLMFHSQWVRRKLLQGVGVGWGWGARRPISQPPPPCPPCRERELGAGGGGGRCPTCRSRGGGGSTPTCMAQNKPHVALIILTTHMWGRIFAGGKFFSGQNLCSGTCGANMHCYTKQRDRHGSPFLQPPLFWRVSAPPQPPQFSGRHVCTRWLTTIVRPQ